MVEGLEDVVAARTRLSDVDGAAGTLIIRGHRVQDLAERFAFEDVAALLFDESFDQTPTSAGFGEARVRAFETLEPVLTALAALPLYDGMRAGLAMLGDGDTLEDALGLIAAPAVLVPALLALREGRPPTAPDAAFGHARDIARMLGRPDRANALDAYLVTVCDHGLNASTFAARVVASTAAGLGSAVLAGLGALKGPLHGGAPGPVIAMLDAIAAEGDAKAWIHRELSRGRRLMGFGHRIYRVRDPRADALKAALRRLGPADDRLAFADRVEQAALAALRRAKPDRPLDTNVEFYTALLLEAVGFPPDAFTAVFAMGRTAGWIAHAREQAATGRLIRPQSRYVGPLPGLAA